MIKIPAGTYEIGSSQDNGFAMDNEKPKTSIFLSSYWIDETTVTNQEFLEFVKETGYVTESEKFGWSFVFHYLIDEDTKEHNLEVPGLPWWFAVKGADWRHPEGPSSTIEGRMDHPVVQVSRNDALAYCKWANKRLPTEAQWEVAAKGGTQFEKWPWGDESLEKDGKFHCNTWQGDFPRDNSKDDGFVGTAPVKSFEPNGYGLYQMIGNVWEWCLNPARIPLTEFQKKDSDYFWQRHQEINDEMYATRGGSFLCHESYCKRYRIAARNGNTGASAASNVGFRCVKMDV